MPHYFRRSLALKEQIPAIGAAVGAGVGVYYLARLFLERTPLQVARDVREREDAAKDLEPPLEIGVERRSG